MEGNKGWRGIRDGGLQGMEGTRDGEVAELLLLKSHTAK